MPPSVVALIGEETQGGRARLNPKRGFSWERIEEVKRAVRSLVHIQPWFSYKILLLLTALLAFLFIHHSPRAAKLGLVMMSICFLLAIRYFKALKMYFYLWWIKVECMHICVYKQLFLSELVSLLSVGCFAPE